MPNQTTQTKLAVLVSGSGTLLEAMIEAGLPIALVLADKPCRGLEIAAAAGIETVLVARTDSGYRPGIDNWDREGFSAQVTHELQSRGVTLVVMAGFMTVLTEPIFESYGSHILNSHPALLPAFPGAHAVRDALAAGVTKTGTTIHIATPIVDDSRFILGQKAVAVRPDDTESTLHERIKVQERRLYPQVLANILAGRLDLEGHFQ